MHHQTKWSHPPSVVCDSTKPLNDDVIQWKHFPRYWPFVRGIHRSPVISPHKGQWRGDLIFFDMRLNKWLSKQSWDRWSETPSHPLWCHCNDTSFSHLFMTFILLHIRWRLYMFVTVYYRKTKVTHACLQQLDAAEPKLPNGVCTWFLFMGVCFAHRVWK